MPVDYHGKILPDDDTAVKMAKSIIAEYVFNKNLLYPIHDCIDHVVEQLAIPKPNEKVQTGVWTRVTETWITRAEGDERPWGEPGKLKPDARDPDTSPVRHRQIQLLGSSPCPLPACPDQVFMISVPSEMMCHKTTRNSQYVEGVLQMRLDCLERLTRQCVVLTFDRDASIHRAPNSVLMRHFLFPPIKLMNNAKKARIDTAHSAYNHFWPQRGALVSDGCALQTALDRGNSGMDTLIVLGHWSYNHTDWKGWAGLMSSMTPMSSFGIGYCADQDVKYRRNRELYGRDALDYIIAITNKTLQALARVLDSSPGHEVFSSANFLMQSSEDITLEDAVAILAINDRDRRTSIQRDKALNGGTRTPGAGVSWEFSAAMDL